MSKSTGPITLCALVLFTALSVRAIEPAGSIIFDEEMESYKATPDSGELKRLQERLACGAVELKRDSTHGYLLSLLKELNVPVSSQMLVAAKTSWNNELVSPKNPRALYYNDSAWVAYVPGGDVIELAGSDPRLGLVFYTLNQKELKPRLQRDDRCLECHASARTLGVPGLLVRSFRTKQNGEVDLLSGVAVTHRTPLAERWGGYYVTGTHGAQTHRGNLFGPDSKSPNGNITDLSSFIDISKYPDRGSDIFALMVLEHQAHMQALLTRLAADAAAALEKSNDLRPVYPSCEAVLKYMLFQGEATLTAPVRGTSDFARAFESCGPFDKHGRSLRQFDLQTRLFKFPCSYMIGSPSFAALPDRVRKHLYRRLDEILAGEDDEFRLPAESRLAIREILVETLHDAPLNWRLESAVKTAAAFENQP